MVLLISGIGAAFVAKQIRKYDRSLAAAEAGNRSQIFLASKYQEK